MRQYFESLESFDNEAFPDGINSLNQHKIAPPGNWKFGMEIIMYFFYGILLIVHKALIKSL